MAIISLTGKMQSGKDLTGKIILSKKDIQISNVEASLNLSNAATGIYFVKITADNQSIVKRIIKE